MLLGERRASKTLRTGFESVPRLLRICPWSVRDGTRSSEGLSHPHLAATAMVAQRIIRNRSSGKPSWFDRRWCRAIERRHRCQTQPRAYGDKRAGLGRGSLTTKTERFRTNRSITLRRHRRSGSGTGRIAASKNVCKCQRIGYWSGLAASWVRSVASPCHGKSVQTPAGKTTNPGGGRGFRRLLSELSARWQLTKKWRRRELHPRPEIRQ